LFRWWRKQQRDYILHSSGSEAKICCGGGALMIKRNCLGCIIENEVPVFMNKEFVAAEFTKKDWNMLLAHTLTRNATVSFVEKGKWRYDGTCEQI
jgi:hypothetical protein